MSASGRVIKERTNIKTPVMMMIGSEDYVLGAEGGEACRQYSLNSLICIDSLIWSNETALGFKQVQVNS